MTEQRIRIEVELGVERQNPAVAGENERIDLRQRCIAVDEGAVQPLHEFTRFGQGAVGHADLAGDGIGIGVGQAGHRIDRDLVDLLRRVRGHLLDFHSTLGTGHEGHALRAAIDHHPDVQLLADVGALLHQEPFDQAAFRACLVGDQRHAEDGGCMLMHLVERLGHLHAAALAPAARVNLGLDHPDLAAERAGRGIGVRHGKTRHALGGRDPVLAQDFLALIFMHVHALLLLIMRQLCSIGLGD